MIMTVDNYVSPITTLLDWYQEQLDNQLVEEGIVPVRVADYFSPYTPLGWDTVLGYLAKHDPLVLSMLDEEAESTLRDGYWLSNRCKKLGIKPVKVPACTFLVRQGIFEVNSYPERLLVERFMT